MLLQRFDKKGVEALPLNFLIISLLSVFLVSLISCEIGGFSSIFRERSLVVSVLEVEKLAAMLRDSSDFGSFTRTKITVPKDYSVVFGNRSITLLRNNNPFHMVNSSLTFLNDLSLGSAKHELELFYGESAEAKNNTLYFL